MHGSYVLKDLKAGMSVFQSQAKTSNTWHVCYNLPFLNPWHTSDTTFFYSELTLSFRILNSAAQGAITYQFDLV